MGCRNFINFDTEIHAKRGQILQLHSPKPQRGHRGVRTSPGGEGNQLPENKELRVLSDTEDGFIGLALFRYGNPGEGEIYPRRKDFSSWER